MEEWSDEDTEPQEPANWEAAVGILLESSVSSNALPWAFCVSCMIIPNAERAVVDVRKLRDYCLNSTHDEGKHKARLFESMLGMTANDAEELRRILLEVIKTHEV